MTSYKKLKEIRTQDIGDYNNRCYNCPTKIVLDEIFGAEIKGECVNEFSKYILPLVPKKIKEKYNFNYCAECRLASIIIYKSATRNKI